MSSLPSLSSVVADQQSDQTSPTELLSWPPLKLLTSSIMKSNDIQFHYNNNNDNNEEDEEDCEVVSPSQIRNNTMVVVM